MAGHFLFLEDYTLSLSWQVEPGLISPRKLSGSFTIPIQMANSGWDREAGYGIGGLFDAFQLDFATLLAPTVTGGSKDRIAHFFPLIGRKSPFFWKVWANLIVLRHDV